MWKNALVPPMEAQYGKMQIDPKYSFHQIERTGKSSDVLNIQWHFFKKVPWGIVHYYSESLV